MTAAKFIIRSLWKVKYYTLATFGLFALSRVFIYLDNYCIAALFGYVGTHPEQAFSSAALSWLAVYAALHFGSNIADGVRTFFEYRMDIRLKKNLLVSLFRQTHKHSPAYFAAEMSGTVSDKILSLENSTRTIVWRLKGFLEGVIVPYAVAFPILFQINGSLALTLFVFCIAVSIIDYAHCRKLKPVSRDAAKLESAVSGIMVDSIANARLVKNCAAFPHERACLAKAVNKWVRSCIQRGKEMGISFCYNNTLLMALHITSLSILIYYWQIKDLNLTQTLIALTYINLLKTPCSFFGEASIQFQKDLGAVEDALNLLYKPLEITDAPYARRLVLKRFPADKSGTAAPAANTLHPATGTAAPAVNISLPATDTAVPTATPALRTTPPSISFQNVTFSYTPDKPLFSNLNLNIDAGEKVGIVGLSGAGKSTLINLLLRAYDLQNGKILIAGQNIAGITLFSLHQNISLIAQEPALFNRSILENIRFARPKAADEEVRAAARLACIHDTIMRLPKGYGSIVGDRGVKLSGGERQRIAIASAILKNAPLLILDEATSALDSESEAAIQQALQNIMQHKTVIAIAHRLSTLKNMDRIIVLDNGKIIEDGTPHKLLKNKNGLFCRLYNLQISGTLPV